MSIKRKVPNVLKTILSNQTADEFREHAPPEVQAAIAAADVANATVKELAERLESMSDEELKHLDPEVRARILALHDGTRK